MSANLILAVVGGVLVAGGAFLMLERSILRILAGFLLAGNGVNVLLLVASGTAGRSPIVGEKESLSDPLPQALMLTAIVITLAISAFLMALSYRSFQLDGHDEVADDVEDALVRRRAEADQTSAGYSTDYEASATDKTDSETGGKANA